jgi:hypothetical protein
MNGERFLKSKFRLFTATHGDFGRNTKLQSWGFATCTQIPRIADNSILRGVFLNYGDDDMTGSVRNEDSAHRLNFQALYEYLKNGSPLSVSFRKNSSYALAIAWASERIAELEMATKKQGDGIAETSDDENREVFLSLRTDYAATAINHCEAVAWGQTRVRQIELENENLSKTVSALCNSWHFPAGAMEEEIHQRRRRERMLDEITLICVRNQIASVSRIATEETRWGQTFRHTAENMCNGINEYDATN